MASLLSQVFFQCLVAYLLWKVLKWAGGEGRGVQNVYKGIGLNGGWGCWEVGWLEWKLMWCFWVLQSHTYISSPMHCRQSGRYVGKWTSNSNQFVSLEILSRPMSSSSDLQ